MANFCRDCISWERLDPVIGQGFGICHNVGVAMKVAMDGKTHLAEDGILWTDAYFGCIYWRDTPNALVDVSKILK
jgi:hypothetical protein